MNILIRLVVVGGITLFSHRLLSQNLIPTPSCNIKGNISLRREGNKFVSVPNKKLYHLPGMKDYKITKISPKKGERWFCTESEAIANGWKKAPR